MSQYKYAASAAKAADRFWSKVEKTDDCWFWTSAVDRDGYGQFRFPWGQVKAHRFAYEQSVGPIPDGLTIDHLCRVKNCVNPAHMEPTSSVENIRRGGNAIKTHCIHGHGLNGDNLVMHKGRRHCRICNNATQRRYQERKRLGIIEIPA